MGKPKEFDKMLLRKDMIKLLTGYGAAGIKAIEEGCTPCIEFEGELLEFSTETHIYLGYLFGMLTGLGEGMEEKELIELFIKINEFGYSIPQLKKLLKKAKPCFYEMGLLTYTEAGKMAITEKGKQFLKGDVHGDIRLKDCGQWN